MTLIAGKAFTLEDGSRRAAGHPLPEASSWKNLDSCVNVGHVFHVQEGKPLVEQSPKTQVRVRRFGTEQLLIDAGILAGEKSAEVVAAEAVLAQKPEAPKPKRGRGRPRARA